MGTWKWPIFWFAGSSLGLELTSTTTILVPSSLAVGLSENMEPKNWFIAGADPGFLMGVAETNQPPDFTFIYFKLSYVCPKTWRFRKKRIVHCNIA